VQHEIDHLNGLFFFDRMSEDNMAELIEPLEELDIEFRAKQKGGAIPADEELVKRLAQWETRYA
jgi:peptide deformylase